MVRLSTEVPILEDRPLPVMSFSTEMRGFVESKRNSYIATKKYHPVLVSVDHGSYTGEPTGTGHAWVCDGYYRANYQTDYELYVIPMGMGEITEMINPYSSTVYPPNITFSYYYHMNWGWGGNKDGYYYGDHINLNPEINRIYSSNRKNLIIARQ